MTGHRHMRKPILILAALLVVLLSGCRGGGLVFKGTHESQDEALLSRLSEMYSDMTFTCTGRTEGAVHTIEAADGTQFPAWTAPAARGEFQVLEYYLEEWLAAQGFYDTLENELKSNGFGFDYGNYNHYERHFQFRFGELDDPERLKEAADTFIQVKEEYDRLRQDFQESTGCKIPLLYFHSSFLYGGDEHFVMLYLSMREDDVWNKDYPFDDYEACLLECIDNIGKTPNEE